MSEAYSEKPVSFPTHDGKKIYGDFVKSKKHTKSLIIYAHGLCSWRNDHIYLNSSREFARLGYDSLRMSFYDWQKGARSLTHCDLTTHVRDLETAIKRYRRRYKKIYLIGHSWGGLTIAHSACKGATAVSLWDPSFAPATWWEKGPIKKVGHAVISKGSVDFLMSEKMLKQALTLDKKACRALAARFTVPMQVIQAKKCGILYKMGESFHTHAKGVTNFHIIPEAEHHFLAESAQAKLVRATASWFAHF